MAIITVGAFNAGVANNVIPQTATLKLSVRSLDRDVRVLLEKRICELVHAQAQSYAVTANIDYQRGYPVLVNTPGETEVAREVALALVGADNVVLQTEPLTASEDFAFFLEKVPGCFINIGNGVGSVGGCMVHNAGYDFNDRILSTGATYWVKLVERWLAKV